MKISNIQKIKFTRALTTKEKKDFEIIQTKAKEQLGLDKSLVTFFDFSFPSNKDTGIGTSLSSKAQEVTDMLKTMCGINGIQLQPQGQVSDYIRSPYSGTTFSLGNQIIDLEKLATDKYENLLSESDLESKYMNRVKRHDTVDYQNVFSEDGQKAMLEIAYKNFIKLSSTAPLKKEYEQFKKDNAYWLEKDALFEAAAIANDSQDIVDWSEKDRYLFAKKDGDSQRIKELKEIENNGINVVDFEEFIQFIADKELKDAKNEYNSKGIDIYGDCLIGFSQKDFWAHRTAFDDNNQFGCEIQGGNHSCWAPAIDFDKLNGEAGELLYNKFDLFFKRYNGVRIDAAWQLINPLICEPLIKNGKYVYDNDGNMLGKPIKNQPQIPHNKKFIMNDIILKAAKNNGISPDKVLLELLGGKSYESLDAVKDSDMTLIHITRYGSDSWGRVKYFESKSDNKYQNMQSGEYIIGPGTHDNESLIEQSKMASSRLNYLSKDLKTEVCDNVPSVSSAILGELYTTSNQFITIPDLIGQDKRINIPNTQTGNWVYRLPQNYEQEYYTNLSKGTGLNYADALCKAMHAKGIKNPTYDKLHHYSQILKQQGPMTTKEADKLYYNA